MDNFLDVEPGGGFGFADALGQVLTIVFLAALTLTHRDFMILLYELVNPF
jgi:hypothetical protein